MFDCGCSCDYGDYDAPEFFNIKEVKARIPHFCSECGEVIEKGKRYTYIVGKWNGKVEAYKQCHFCSKIASVCCAPLGCLWDEFLGGGEFEKEDLGLRIFMPDMKGS